MKFLFQLFFIAFLYCLYIGDVRGESTCSIEGDCPNQEAEEECVDLHENCEDWAESDECAENPDYMLVYCRKACQRCNDKPREEDYGVPQATEGNHEAEILSAIEDMQAYFHKIRNDPSTSHKMHELFDNCKLKHENCAFWKALGECENNPRYMHLDCAPICQTCELLSIEFRCPLDPEAPNAWKPGDLNQFFTNITTLPDFSIYEPHILSKPEDINISCSESFGCKDGPWLVLLDNFLSDEEADRLIQLGSNLGYERSTGTGPVKFDGRNEHILSESRTSSNAWCIDECYKDDVVKNVIARIETVTNIPETNSEYLQLLQYDVGQFYLEHHDYIGFHIDRQMGVRILTFFLYLNDVEEGGGTNFPLLDLTVTPKKGRAVIWSHVLNDDPHSIDSRTEHQALPVIKGVKYGANAWIHQRDFKVSDSKGCQ